MALLPVLAVLATVVQGGSVPEDTPAQEDNSTTVVAQPDQVKPEPAKEKKFDAIAIPLLSYNSDQGVGFGAVGGAYLYAPGYKPYRHALALNVFFTTLGIQNHWIRYDGPRLIGNNRLELRVEHRRELLAPYYGVGNVSSPGFNGDVTDKRFNYDRLSPGAWVRLRGQPFGDGHPFQPYIGYAFRYTRVHVYPGSVLEQEQPLGIAGGPTGQLIGGLLWDTRDDENDATRGGAEELSVRAAARPTGSAYNFWGVTLSERRYFKLGSPRLVFAQRFTADALFGDVPFFEWANIGGTATPEGIGGMSSVRGIPRNRYAGDVKVFSNSELRFYAFDFPFRGEPVHVGGLMLVDFGRVWHPNVDDGAWYSWHPGVGAGIRVARKAAVLRFDWGYAPEFNRNAVYVSFGHMF
ncbi:MAG: Omp85 family outer membrane protein [Myxococcaceae bacterium]